MAVIALFIDLLATQNDDLKVIIERILRLNRSDNMIYSLYHLLFDCDINHKSYTYRIENMHLLLRFRYNILSVRPK